MRIVSASLLFISYALVSCVSPAAAQQTPIGYVMEIQGTWRLNEDTSRALERWQKLPPDSSIRVESPSPEDYIVIAGLSGGIIERRRCADGGCSQPLRLSTSTRRRSLTRVIFDATVELLLGSPDRYSIHRNRGYERALSDGIVKLDSGAIDFSPVVKSTGRYNLRWRALPRAGQAGTWSSPLVIRLERGRPALVAVPGFQPGLYEVNLLRSMGGHYEPFASAWVLVSSVAEYESAVTSFRQAVRLTEEWGDQVELETSRRFLRAHLDHLAGQASK